MIRLHKPVKLLEWGEGTTTLNQIWTECAQGKIASCKQKDGLTTIVVETPLFTKKNAADNNIKIVQVGEGMTPRSNMWGEVALGLLAGKETQGTKTLVTISINTAAKIDRRAASALK